MTGVSNLSAPRSAYAIALKAEAEGRPQGREVALDMEQRVLASVLRRRAGEQHRSGRGGETASGPGLGLIGFRLRVSTMGSYLSCASAAARTVARCRERPEVVARGGGVLGERALKAMIESEGGIDVRDRIEGSACTDGLPASLRCPGRRNPACRRSKSSSWSVHRQSRGVTGSTHKRRRPAEREHRLLGDERPRRESSCPWGVLRPPGEASRSPHRDALSLHEHYR